MIIVTFSNFTRDRMNLILKKKNHTSRGIIGIESAIVLIAFVIVAAALAFVVLNMGFATTQKTKTSITSALGEAGSSVQVSGKVIGASGGGSPLTAVMIPIKLTTGGNSVDLSEIFGTISYLGDGVEFDNVFRAGCSLFVAENPDPDTAWTAAIATGCIGAGENPISAGPIGATTAIVYFPVMRAPFNSILEQGEHAVISMAWLPAEQPASLEKIKIELTAATGATLTVERTIPNISSTIVDLG